MNHTILLVEDNENNRYLAKFLLERAGFEVAIALNGKEALERVYCRKPDLIVMDIQMPEMDGYSTATHLKSHPETAGIPLVGVSAFVTRDDRRKAIQAGFDGYIEKPINPETFGRQVADFLQPPKADR